MNACMAFLTPGISTKDEFPDLIVNKDKETVRERAEPPAGPDGARPAFSLKASISQIPHLLCWNYSWRQLHDLLQRVHAQRNVHAGTVGQERCQSCFLKQAEDQNFVPVRNN